MGNLASLQSFIRFLQPFWPYFVAGVGFLLMVGTALHVVFNKRDIRAATGWLGLVWFAPVLGVILYCLFGVNRIQRLAKSKFAAKQIVPLPKLATEVTADFIKKNLAVLIVACPCWQNYR